jgi:hypothetical protein
MPFPALLKPVTMLWLICDAFAKRKFRLGQKVDDGGNLGRLPLTTK